jgi:hypothetical protein
LRVYEKADTVSKWKFAQYVSPHGRHAIEDWRKTLPVGPQRADMDTFLRMLAKMSAWNYPQIKDIQGARYKGLTELRWRSGGVQHRLVGYQTGEHDYLLLIGCTHKDRRYDPPDAFDTAVERRNWVKCGKATTCEYNLTLG